MFAHGRASLQLLPLVWIFAGYHLLRQMSSQWQSQKLLQRLVSHELTAYLSIFNLFKLHELWPYYQKHVYKPDNFEYYNSLKLSFPNIWGLLLKFVHCESFLESNSLDILALWDKPGWLNWLWYFSVTGFLVLICMVSQFMWKEFLLHGTNI